MKHRNCGALRRVLSLCLALAMLLALLPATRLITEVSASSQTVTVYFKNSDGWGDVYGYVWDSSNTALMGTWPGTKLSTDSTGMYKLSVEYVPTTTGTFNFIFNSGSGSQTADLSLTYSQVVSGNTYWVSGAAGQPAVYAPPTISGGKVTFTYEGTASSVLLAGSMNGWAGASMTKSGSTFTYTCDLQPGQYEY